ncbi:MAG: hypothetical protein IJ523_10685 [Succinivibrionaceae bacterium]|nr:hypothetical protein [Succinivibrionaceae bacterium]
MTVKELVEELKQYPSDMDVVLEITYDNAQYTVSGELRDIELSCDGEFVVLGSDIGV